MAFKFNTTITGDELTGYGCGLDQLDTQDIVTLIQRAELVSTVIHRLIQEEEHVLTALTMEVKAID